MAGTVFDGRALADRIKTKTAQRIQDLKQEGTQVRLDAILVGDPAAGQIFAQSQKRRCEEVGIEYVLHGLPPTATQEDIEGLIETLNRDPEVTGILLNLPLPAGIDTPAVQYCIDPYKDIEGVNPVNIGMLFYNSPIMAPCTALAVMKIIEEHGEEVRGKNVTVVGTGRVTGRPMALDLMSREATVTSCNVYTRDLVACTQSADIVIATAGVPELIRGEHIREGSIVIDVGINRVPVSPGSSETRIVGDVCFDEVIEKASMVSPVPGGVGPVTVAMVLKSATYAARHQRGPRRIHG